MYFCMAYNSLYGFVLQFVNQIIDVIKHMSGLALSQGSHGGGALYDAYGMHHIYNWYILADAVCLKE